MNRVGTLDGEVKETLKYPRVVITGENSFQQNRLWDLNQDPKGGAGGVMSRVVPCGSHQENYQSGTMRLCCLASHKIVSTFSMHVYRMTDGETGMESLRGFIEAHRIATEFNGSAPNYHRVD